MYTNSSIYTYLGSLLVPAAGGTYTITNTADALPRGSTHLKPTSSTYLGPGRMTGSGTHELFAVCKVL